MSISRTFLQHFKAATSDAIRQGRDWYRNAGAAVSELARKHGKSRATAAGVVAATSPRLHWGRNIGVAGELLAGREVRGVLRANVDKARRIIAGAKPLVVLGGVKVKAFYRALMGDADSAVIDTWMVRAAGLHPATRLDRGGMYEVIAKSLGRVARRLSLPTAELQAIIWVVVRGRAE